MPNDTRGMSPIFPGGGGFGGGYGLGSTIPAYDRVTSIPGWLPPERTSELMDQYHNTNAMFDSSEYDRASEEQQSRLLTTAFNSGNEAAADYANRARQSGGSMLGAGLVKAQAVTGARAQSGQMELDRQRFDAEQRDKAATHATAIATTLSNLRNTYLQSIVDYATREDATNSQYASTMYGLRGQNRRSPIVPTAQIGGTPSGPGQQSFRDYNEYIQYMDRLNRNSGTVGGFG